MATVKAFVRTTRKDMANIRFRLSVSRDVILYHVSEFSVNPTLWDNTKQEIKAKVLCPIELRNRIAKGVAERKALILEIYNNAPDVTVLTSEWLDIEIDKRINPNKYNVTKQQSFFDDFNEFLIKNKYSDWQLRSFAVLFRALQRYELYSNTVLTFDNITPNVLSDFDNFIRNEYAIADKYPYIYEAVPESRKPQQRGQNTINGIFVKMRTLFLWAIRVSKTTNNPFKNFKIEESVYGTPVYISIDERDKLYQTNLSRHPKLAIQRDIFVFQCLIGCRVGDLYRFTRQNIINGAIEYVARKTKEGRPITVRVPLSPTASEIVKRYQNINDERLFPFISEQKYNIAIKRMFLAAGLRRPVTIINQTTREPEIRVLNEIASSHLARRAFIGNLYKQVKDPNLVGALSGHRDGSRAFARYRDIDEDIKRDLVGLLEKKQ